MMGLQAVQASGRVLVVDDDARNRRLLTALLGPEGYEVYGAADGEAALAILRERGADLVLLDMMMPNVSGIEVCERMREDPRLAHTPVIFVTSMGDRESRIRAKAAGGDDFLTRPVDEDELLARVRNLLIVKLYHEHLLSQNEELERLARTRTQALEKMVARLERAERELRESREATIVRFARIAEFRDEVSPNHTRRVGRLSELLGRRAGLPEDQVELIRLASPLHDVGNVGVRDEILRKPGPLTGEELEQAKRHTEIGHRLLSGAGTPPLEMAATIALSHHEWWSGAGYPRKLSGEAIPLEGRLTAIADVFDTVVSGRSYRPPLPVDEAVEFMAERRGSHFDPRLVDLFLSGLDEALKIREELPDG